VVLPVRSIDLVVEYSLFAENGAIVRNLNHRPWQWAYSLSGFKSFPGGF
jgi:trehalose-6-phosphatase